MHSVCEITFPKKERFSHLRFAWDLDARSKQVMDGAEVQVPYIVDKDGQGRSSGKRLLPQLLSCL